jgi:hypothetical protein
MHPFSRQAAVVFAMLSMASAGSALADGPRFHRHQQGASGEDQDHYKDEGEKPARAQVGRTLFQSRALVDKSGRTELEVTTGTLDSTATPPGYLSEIHVKAFRLDGTHQFNKEFEHLRSGGGYASFYFPLAPAKPARDDDDEGRAKDTRLEHGQLLKLHVEGRGLASGEEGEAEAKLENTVKYRPDLTVTSLHYDPVAKVNTAVDISASVVELMRDTGAHSNCVLTVTPSKGGAGTVVDKSPGIWVDANGAVTCHLLYTFPATDTYTVQVSLENVLPGDYDTANNSLSGSIKIVSPALMAYYSTATDLTNTSQFVRDIFATPTATVPDQHVSSTSTLHTQSRTLTGTISAAVNLPLKKVSYADQSDGTPLSSLVFSDLAADLTSPLTDPTYDSVAMITRYDSSTGGWFTLRRYSNASTGAGVTNVSWNFYGGDVTYHSESYCKSVAGIYACNGGDWTTNSTSGNSLGGATVKLGKTYGADVMVDDGSAYQGHPAMTLVTTSNSAGAPQYCRQVTLNGTLCKVCSASTSSSTVVAGSASFTPPQ